MVIDLNLDPDDGMQQEGHVSGNQQDYEENVSATHSHVHDYNVGKKQQCGSKLPISALILTHQVSPYLPIKLAHSYPHNELIKM